jgi:hypothetical protein
MTNTPAGSVNQRSFRLASLIERRVGSEECGPDVEEGPPIAQILGLKNPRKPAKFAVLLLLPEFQYPLRRVPRPRYRGYGTAVGRPKWTSAVVPSVKVSVALTLPERST